MATTTDLPLVLLTGGTGYIGAHILQQLLDAGYPVRATARPGKVDALRNKYDGKVDVIGVADIAAGDYTEALRDVGAIIHAAAPLPGRADAVGMIDGAVNGSLNIVKQAVAKGVKRIVVTSTILTAIEDLELAYTNTVFSERDWSPHTKEEALTGQHDPVWNYVAAKTSAEHAVWEYADKHPEIDITTINPPFAYGPFATGTIIPKGDVTALSSAGFFYRNIFPPNPTSVTLEAGPQAQPPINIDVRDIAQAHILALRSPPASQVGRKRILIAGPPITWRNAVLHLRNVAPELKDRLPNAKEGGEESTLATVDLSRAQSVLGLTAYVDWKKTVEDGAKSLLEIERSWA